MKHYKLLFTGILSLFLFSACKKDFTPTENTMDKKTPKEKLLIENLASVGKILETLYKTPDNIKVVNAGINSKVYTDESVVLRDLLYPAESMLANNQRFLKITAQQNISLEKFANAFWAEANKNSDANFKTFLTQLKRPKASTARRTGDNLNGDEVTIYFPYSELFLPPDGSDPTGNYTYGTITSIVTATEEADEGIGQLPVYLNGVFQSYRQVVVNDDYAELNPTHIIGINGVEFENPAPPPPPPPPPGVSRIYIGEVFCRNQYDKFIGFNGNGGGSEIVLLRIGGYLQMINQQVTNIQGDEVDVNFTRRQIRRENSQFVFSVWDSDWVQDNKEQILGVYEDDDEGTVKFEGSLTTKVTVSPGVTVDATVKFSVERKSGDGPILQTKFTRLSYFTGAFQDQGHGFSNDATFLPQPFTHGWPWYNGKPKPNPSGGTFGFTWPYQVF